MTLLSTDVMKPYNHALPYAEFNPMQSEAVLLLLNYVDSNVLLAAKTASGKTLLFRVLTAIILHQKNLMLYVGSHRSLVEEKMRECQEAFPDARIEILTGEYTLSDRKKMDLNKADIILMTAEMLDSRVRNRDTEGNSWLARAGGLCIDEFHLLGTKGRGDKVESAVMRFGRHFPQARILALSATMANVEDIQKWVAHLTGRTTLTMVSDYRPCALKYQYDTIPSGLDYNTDQAYRTKKVMELLAEHEDSQFLVFTGNRPWGYKFKALRESQGSPTLFHCSDLSKGDKLEAEEAFKEGECRVLCATTTVAWGVNTPAERVVIVHEKVGIEEIEDFDLQQMAGRAGRPQFHPVGYVHVICGVKNKNYMEQKMTQPCVINSQIAKNLAFHILASVVSGDVCDLPSLKTWYGDTFASFQDPVDDDELMEAVEELEKLGMISMMDDGDTWEATHMGKVAARLYLNVQDAAAWARNFSRLEKTPSNKEIGYAYADVPTYREDFLSNADKSYVRVPVGQPGVQKWGSACVEALMGLDDRDQHFRAQVLTIRNDIERLGSFLAAVSGKFRCDPKRICLRIKYGVDDGMVELVQIEDVGGARARKLWDAGVYTTTGLVKAGRSFIQKILGAKVGGSVYDSATSMLQGDDDSEASVDYEDE